MSNRPAAELIPLSVAVLTVSDSRTEETDSSGRYLVESLQQAGHTLVEKRIVVDDCYLIRAVVAAWIADASVDVVLITGGTGFTRRDSTPEAVAVLFDKAIDGYGELFRQLSYNEIGTSTLQSRAVAGLANDTLVFCMPGSGNACKTAWEKILCEQLDSRHGPCNFAAVLGTRQRQLES